ncbi:MAG: PaaI family thioesterase [Pseudomonadota bacterium]|nr:PaaI family thioesterase [Pseudomonadota bacterium]
MDKNAATSAFQNAIETHVPAFETFFLAKLFGARISYAAESCIVDISVNDFMFNPQGSLHGGVIAFALDVSMGHLIHHVTKRAAVTLEMKTQYMRPAVSGCVRCEARFLKRGRTVSFLESSMTDSEGKIVAAATATWQMPRE